MGNREKREILKKPCMYTAVSKNARILSFTADLRY